METEVAQTVHHLLLLFLLVFAAGILTGRLASWIKVPDVVLFIGAGMILGQGLHWISEESSSLTNQLVLSAGSALILFDGGRNIRWHGLKQVLVSVTLLSTVGVVVTAGIVGLVAHEAFGLDWMTSLLIGAVISSTDPATIIPVFRQVTVKLRLRETVESESAFNDATGSILTFALLAAIVSGSSPNVGGVSLDFVKTAVGGLAVGFAISAAIVFLVGHAKWGWFRDYAALSMLSVAIAAYLAGELLHVSGLMATFTAGLVWGNARLLGVSIDDKLEEMGHVADNASVMMRMFIFILLGSQVNFSLLGQYFWPALAVVAALVFIARPLTVFSSAWPDRRTRWTGKELLFMCWVRETGVIPAALSGMIVASGIAHADKVSAVVLMAVVFTILVQASTTAWLARKLGLEEKRSSSGA
ncbi:cation:proton antiporter [Cohnella suwonensis]|uniref:Cation:proton antiporter n=1 Tax=Cohnella suwonensis TaxID=696072 RepID=A0ABW0LY53_9BACL